MGPKNRIRFGAPVPNKRNIVSLSGWMDGGSVNTNSLYIGCAIIRERLADPAYGGNELYKI